MKLDYPDRLSLQLVDELALARLQSASLFTDRAGVAVSAGDKIKTSLDAALDLLEFLRKMTTGYS